MTYINTYQIISTFDGSTETCSLSELSRQMKLNYILCELGADGTLIDSCPLDHRALVAFAVEFADYALKHYSKQKIPESEACIALIRKWLKNSYAVSAEELRVATAASNAAAYAVATRTAAYAADAATRAGAATLTAAYAVDVARKAAKAAGKSREAEYVRQGGFIVEYLRAV